jgi:hypothetical protein
MVVTEHFIKRDNIKAPKHMEGLLLAKSAKIYTDTNGGATVSILEATKQKLEAEELLKKA